MTDDLNQLINEGRKVATYLRHDHPEYAGTVAKLADALAAALSQIPVVRTAPIFPQGDTILPPFHVIGSGEDFPALQAEVKALRAENQRLYDLLSRRMQTLETELAMLKVRYTDSHD